MTRNTHRHRLQVVASVVGSWSELVLYMGDAAGMSWSQLRWYRLQRLAFKLDAGKAVLHQDRRGRLFVNAWRRCRLFEATLEETGYDLQSAMDAEPRKLPVGQLRPQASWNRLFRDQFESHIPRPSTLLPLPWRRQARRLLRDPDLGAIALDAFRLPRRWRRLKRFMARMDDEDATVYVNEAGRVHIHLQGRCGRHRLLEQALRAWTTTEDYVVADAPPPNHIHAPLGLLTPALLDGNATTTPT